MSTPSPQVERLVATYKHYDSFFRTERGEELLRSAIDEARALAAAPPTDVHPAVHPEAGGAPKARCEQCEFVREFLDRDTPFPDVVALCAAWENERDELAEVRTELLKNLDADFVADDSTPEIARSITNLIAIQDKHADERDDDISRLSRRAEAAEAQLERVKEALRDKKFQTQLSNAISLLSLLRHRGGIKWGSVGMCDEMAADGVIGGFEAAIETIYKSVAEAALQGDGTENEKL